MDDFRLALVIVNARKNSMSIKMIIPFEEKDLQTLILRGTT